MSFSRRQFLAAPLAAQPRRSARPNVLVFMSDQESALLPGPARLLNRQRLLKNATQFTSAFCNTPQCSPARSSLLTGLEPNQTHVLGNVDESSTGKGLAPELPNVGSVFQKAGFSTGYFGKWHLSGGRGGLDTFGFSHTQMGRDEASCRAAAEWIGKQKGPWLAWVSILNPHDIYQITREIDNVKEREGVRPPHSDSTNLKGKPAEQQEFIDKDQGKPTKDWTAAQWIRYRSFYLNLLEKADSCLGIVLDAVKDPESTITVYTTDHGDALGEHGLPFKGPFMYEELLRIPLAISAPGRLKPGKRDDMVIQADLAPTLAALGGLEWPSKITGQNLMLPVQRDAVFLEYYAKQRWVNPIRTIRTRRWKLNWYDRGNKELYDLTSDPHETINRAADPSAASVRQDLEDRLTAWRPPLISR